MPPTSTHTPPPSPTPTAPPPTPTLPVEEPMPVAQSITAPDAEVLAQSVMASLRNRDKREYDAKVLDKKEKDVYWKSLTANRVEGIEELKVSEGNRLEFTCLIRDEVSLKKRRFEWIVRREEGRCCRDWNYLR
jgi:hypothetical protein